ncbi:MAG: hypothetical protein O2856_13120 [Planctomycetota bacterium]|nr:hypothetical protein [Planctomycetota bacterium]
MAAAQALGDERRHKRRWSADWLNKTIGLSVAEKEVAEFDVSGLNFDDVCDELLLGSARC